MNGLDLFSGIGGLTKGLGGYVEPVAYCENDRYAQAVLLSRMSDGTLPTAPIWDDVQSLHGCNIPAVDIVYGGFPCQDISVAGRGAGLAGERSGLFFEVVRLVSEIRPRFVFLENVAAITVRGAERVVGEFCRLGYDCRWGILSAADVGANHRRERWWLLAHSRHVFGRDIGSIEGWEEAPQEWGGDHDAACGPGEYPEDVADAKSGRWLKGNTHPRGMSEGKIETTERPGSSNDGWWISEPNVGRVANGISCRVDRLRGLGNAVVPAQAREAFERLMGLK